MQILKLDIVTWQHCICDKKNTGIEGRVIAAASAATQKLGLKVKQMNVVMGILSEREVLIKR